MAYIYTTSIPKKPQLVYINLTGIIMNEDINWVSIERSILNEQRVKSGLKTEELREKIDPEPIIKGLLTLVGDADTCELVDLPRLRFKADVMFGILKKVMPDLRSLEVSEKDNKRSTLIIQMEPSAIKKD